MKWKSTKKTRLGKQLRQWAWLAVSQASQTPGLGPNSSPRWEGKTHRHGGRGRSGASATEHKDISIRLNAVFIKSDPLLTGDGCYETVRSRGSFGQQGWHWLSVFAASTCSASKQQRTILLLLSSCTENQIVLFFVVNNLLTFAKCSLKWRLLYFTSWRSPANHTAQGGLWHNLYEVWAFVSCIPSARCFRLFQTKDVEEKKQKTSWLKETLFWYQFIWCYQMADIWWDEFKTGQLWKPQ